MKYPFSLLSMCESAFALNVLVRERRLRAVRREHFYALKNELVKYLYQHGYAVEVKEQKQEHECWTCGGDPDGCYRCNYTGVYRTVRFYAFVFRVDGKTFKWHQIQNYCDYPVELTEAEVSSYSEPAPRTDLKPSERLEALLLAQLWVGLWLHGARQLPKFGLTVFIIRMFAPRRFWYSISKFRGAARSRWRSIIDHLPVRKCATCGRLYILKRHQAANNSWGINIHFCCVDCEGNYVPF